MVSLAETAPLLHVSPWTRAPPAKVVRRRWSVPHLQELKFKQIPQPPAAVATRFLLKDSLFLPPAHATALALPLLRGGRVRWKVQRAIDAEMGHPTLLTDTLLGLRQLRSSTLTTRQSVQLHRHRHRQKARSNPCSRQRARIVLVASTLLYSQSNNGLATVLNSFSLFVVQTVHVSPRRCVATPPTIFALPGSLAQPVTMSPAARVSSRKRLSNRRQTTCLASSQTRTRGRPKQAGTAAKDNNAMWLATSLHVQATCAPHMNTNFI